MALSSESGPSTVRRKPRQSRSIALCRAVLISAREVLEKEGPDQLTLRRVAKRAGVGLGSIYHYFPSKDAIVAELLEEEVEHICSDIETMASDVHLEELAPFDAIRELVSLGLAQRARLAAIHAELFATFEERFDVTRRRSPKGARYHDVTVGWVRELLERNQQRIAVGDLDVAAVRVVEMTEALIRAFAGAGDRQVCDDIARAICGYIGASVPERTRHESNTVPFK
jgi:AcrR family transcriptional regulator